MYIYDELALMMGRRTISSTTPKLKMHYYWMYCRTFPFLLLFSDSSLDGIEYRKVDRYYIECSLVTLDEQWHHIYVLDW